MRPGHRSLVDGELLAQGQVLEGELALGAEQEGEEPKEVDRRTIIEPRFSPDQSRQINHLPADGVLARDNGQWGGRIGYHRGGARGSVRTARRTTTAKIAGATSCTKDTGETDLRVIH